MVIRCLPFQSEAMRDWANTALAADTNAVSDGLPAFQVLRDEVESHLAIVTGSGRASAEHPEFRWVNIMLGNLTNEFPAKPGRFRGSPGRFTRSFPVQASEAISEKNSSSKKYFQYVL